MSPQALRIAIALILGARWYLFDSGYTWISFKDLTVVAGGQNSRWKQVESPHDVDKIVIGDTVPDYLSDLNAMHEAEKRFGDSSHDAHRYLDALMAVVSREEPDPSTNVAAVFFIVNATAAQRAEAFLRCIGKWVE